LIFAHGIGGRTDLPIPITILIVGSAAVLVVSFMALALLWPQPRLQSGPRYGEGGLALPGRRTLNAIGVLGLILVIGQLILALLHVATDPGRPSIAPVMVWVVFWLVLPFAGAVFGNWYADINPWRTLAGVFGIGSRERIGLPHRVGLWPATGVLVGFVWLELVSASPADPATLGAAALVYTVVLLAAMAVVGRETGLTLFDAFTPYNRLISSISPLGRSRSGQLVWRGWLRALPVLPEWPGLWVFVVAMIATVSFDGSADTDWFRALTGGVGDTTAGATALLLATVAVIGAAYYGAAAAAARLGGINLAARDVAQRFAHTLVPIALAYAVSHYFTLIIFEGQQLVATLSDPFALGWDLFGTADRRVDYFITSSTPIWLTQVGLIVGGHVIAVVLAHDRSLQDFGPGAVRSQYAMLALMIALTSLGLLILSG